MTIPRIYRKVRLLILAMVIPLTGLLAASESYVQSLTGHLKKGDSLTVIDDKFLNLPLDQWNQLKHLSIDDIISFELRHDTALQFFTKKFTCTLSVTIKYYTSRDQQTPKEIDSVNLVVNYDTTRGKSFADMARYRFKNAFKVTVVINSISSPEWKDKLPDCFRLKGEILVERKYPFDGHSNGKLHLGAFEPVEPKDMLAAAGPKVPEPASMDGGVATSNGQMTISWTASDFAGAEEFDLEWTFVDIMSAWGQAINASYGGTAGPFTVPEATEAQWMLHNSTRVTVTSSPYSINLPYVEGYVLVRIRSASYQTGTNLRLTGSWVYTDDAGNATVAYLAPRQTALNYQYTGSFAEGGKRKEVTTYYDGSQRSRQSVTVNNSDLTYQTAGAASPIPTAVVQETIYDVMGRPTVNALPAPTKSSVLDYEPAFNLNNSGAPYSFADITLASPTTSCAIAAVPMSTTSGASQYYSPSNTFLDAQNIVNYYFNPYIPDAQQYPFSVTQYMPDNTGRIARQGGVGPTLQTGGANDTKYFYGKPTPTELLRMFGMEAGDPSHYLKNMVIDPNGQASLSFIDANGKTIATALTGGAPATMDALPTANSSTAETPLNDVLIQPADFTVDAGNLNMSATTTFLAETTGGFAVVYSINPLALTTSYAGGASTLCNNCYYTVAIKITDPCGNVLQNQTTTPFQVNDFTCYVNPPPLTGTLNFTASQLGSYTVSYSLQLSNDVINAQTNYYVATNTDLQTLQTFFNQQLNAMSLSGCYSTCDACKTLGSLQDFQTQVQGVLAGSGFAGINVNDPGVQSWISAAYQTLSTQCSQVSCSAPSPCDQKLQQLEQDVLPGGQYALYDPVALANNATTVFLQPQINVMEFYNQDPAISTLTITAANGSTQQVGNLSQADFVRAYLQNPQWASLFVVHHIEYCSYLWCKDASYTPAADNNEVSYTFDATLQQNYTAGSDAVTAGYYNHADPLALLEKDPWFNSGRGVAYYSKMQADLLNLTTALSIAPMDNTVNPPVALPVKNIIQWIDWSLYCAPTSTNTTSAQLTASWNNCSPSASCRSVTMEWQMYLNYYMELKSKYYRIAKLAYNPNCLDCFIGGDPLSTGSCVPPDALANYQVVHINSGGTCGYYIVYNNGNSPFAGNYAITYVLNGFSSSTTGTVNCAAGAMQVPIFTTPVSPGEDCAVTGTYQVTGIVCLPSALSACAATIPTTPSGGSGTGTSVNCPSASAFSLQQVNKVGPTPTPAPPADATCDLTTFQEQLTYSGTPLPVAVTVYVQGVETGGQPTTYSVTIPAGQTTALVANGVTFTNFQGDERVPESQQCATATWTFSVLSTAPVCATPPPTYVQTPGPASTCTSNPNYALYAGKTRVFNDYTDVQDYASCVNSSVNSGSQTQASSIASMLQAAQANLSGQEANWLSLLQNVRSQSGGAIPAIASITDAQLQTLVGDLYNLSNTYLQVAASQQTAMNIVSSLPNPLPSGFTAPGGNYTFMAIFIQDLGSAAVNAGFGPDLLDNVYPYNKVPYPTDPDVTSLSSNIFSNVSTNLTAWQNAWTASGGSGTFNAYLQQQLGDDYLLASSQLSDLQTRVANGCTNPYLANPALLPVALVVANPQSGCNGGPCNPNLSTSPVISSITCSQLTALAASFQAAYPNLPANSTNPAIAQLYQIVYTNYLNHALGYPLSYADYNLFSGTTCPASSAAVLYDKPQMMSVVVNPFSCAAAALQQAYSTAGQAYTLYIDQIRIQFRNAYISKCLSNQASANITGEQYQYHYTLYYYDQSGNLVKTIPPEGVHLLSNQDIATIQQVPTQSPGTCAVFPSTVVYNQPTILSDLSTDLQNNSVQAMEMWLFTNAGGSTRSVRMVTPDGRYMCQAAIANGYVWYELYSLTPDASGNGIDMTLTNAAVAALPPQEVLQNWSYLMVQSANGINGGALTLYVDGNPLTNVPLTSAPAYPFPWEVDGSTGGYTLPTTDVSELQQLRLYNEPATAAQVSADYANSCLGPVGALASASAQVLWGIFNSPTFCNNNTANTTPVTIADRGSLMINSNPDPGGTLGIYALTNVTNTFTVEFWVYPTAQDNIPNVNYIYAGVDYTPPYAIFPLYGGLATTGHANMGVAVGVNGITVFQHAESYLPAVLDWRGNVSGWTHVAVVYNNGIPSLYVNGALATTATTTSYTGSKPSVSPSYNFGGGSYGWMPGNMDEVRIWSVARTQAQIAAAMGQALAPTDQAGLMGYWPMDGTYGTMIHDVSCNGNDATFDAPAMSWSTTNIAPITETNYVPFASRLIVPNHGLPTNYAYNSLNQVITQVTPDAGTSSFLYDRLGRLSISQNAEQNQPAVVDNYNQAGRFSYTRYDALGRITEVGEKLGAATLAETDTRVDATLQNWYSSGSNRMVTVTAYDAAPAWLPNSNIPTANQRKRVAATALLSAGSDPTQNRQSASYYSYDYDGNVAELEQENTALINNEQQVVTGSAGLKDIKYQYDLISGKVNEVLYQDGKWDQFYYQYIYDADNRLINAYTSRNNDAELSLWNNEATYRYYLHGPLARMELGTKGYNQSVQGVDYAYTLQGWLKGINGQQIPLNGQFKADMSGDGVAGQVFSGTAQDAMGMSLGYYAGDYISIQPSTADAFSTYFLPNSNNSGAGTNLYNGNVSSSTYAIRSLICACTWLSGFQAYTYRYDQLNRLTTMTQGMVGEYNVGPGSGAGGWTYNGASGVNDNGVYSEQLSYDGNGNILTDQRTAPNSSYRIVPMDNLTYNYSRDANGNLLSNRLNYINDAVANSGFGVDLTNQPAGNYTYDNNGNLIRDASQNLGMIYWNVYGKMAQIYQGSAPANGGVYGSGAGLAYGYDPGGNRITKTVTASTGTGTTTYYVRDAQGNVLAVYQYKLNSSGSLTEGDWVEQHLYGSSRLGMLRPGVSIPVGQALANDSYNSNMDAGIEMSGNRLYELTNHLGNVLSTVTDVIIPVNGSGNIGEGPIASIASAQDYYPFGMEMPGRTYIAPWSSLNYRYGFNGKENDNEVEGVGNSIDYGMRVYDPRAGRFLSVDPLREKYPWLSPYQFAENDVIRSADLDGSEKQIAIDGSVVNGPVDINAVNASILSNYSKAQQAAMKQAAAEKYMQEFYRTHPQQVAYQPSSDRVESQGTALFRQYLNDPDNIGGQAAYAIANNLHDARVSFKDGDWAGGTLDLLNAGINTVTLTGAGPALGVDAKIIDAKVAGNTEVSNVKTRLPVSNGSWSGEPGNSLWISTLPEVNKITGNEGIPFKNGRIDLSKWSRAEFTIDGMTGTDNDFTLVYKKMVKDWGFPTQKAAKDWLKANGLTPHHESKNTIQLVPTDLNNIPHVGSASDLRN